MDGSSCSKSNIAWIVLEIPEGDTVEYALKFDFPKMDNEEEYEALIAGILAKEQQVQHLVVFSDSQLVVNQVNGDFKVKEDVLSVYIEYVWMIRMKFKLVTFEQIPHAVNGKLDALARLATEQQTKAHSDVRVEHLKKPCREKTMAELCMTTGGCTSWMTNIVGYKQEGILPANKVEARTLIRRARKYFLMEDQLYCKDEIHPHLRHVKATNSIQSYAAAIRDSPLS